MLAWLSEDWYLVTGAVGGLLLLALYIFVRRHPESDTAARWRRLNYTMASGMAVTMILMLVLAMVDVFTPALSLFSILFTEQILWLLVPIYVGAWFAAPYLSKRFPISPF